MSVRNEIKAQIVRAGYTMQEVVDRLHEEYDWSDSVSNLSAKLQRESIRYKEVVELADVLGYELVWQKRRDNVLASRNMPFFDLPSTKGRRLGTLKPTTSAPKRNTPAIPMWTSAGASTISIWSSRNENIVRRQSGRSKKPVAVPGQTVFE